MSTLHFPISLEQINKRFKGADPAALVVFTVAVGFLVAILVAVFIR
jgi:hypothetical protein